jgi:signal transduction histidine kinase
MANTELLLRKPRTADEYREGLERQLRTIRRMKEIVENLLVLARADASAEVLAREPVALGEVLSAACDEIQTLAQEKGVRVLREIAPVRLEGDPKYLAQLASNLLVNAVKFTPAGGAVTARLEAASGTAELSVSDTGPGIPPEHLSHVRERFYRVREGRDASEGAGLGLAIVDWVARRHGGELLVESLPGEGSRFRVRLPLAPA